LGGEGTRHKKKLFRNVLRQGGALRKKGGGGPGVHIEGRGAPITK